MFLPLHSSAVFFCSLHIVYDYDANILDGSINIRKKTTETLVVASKEIGLEVNARGSHSVKTCNISFERKKQFKYLGKILTYQNSIQE